MWVGALVQPALATMISGRDQAIDMGTVRAGRREEEGGEGPSPGPSIKHLSRSHSPSIEPCQHPAISWVPTGPASLSPQLGILLAHAGSKVKQLGS